MIKKISILFSRISIIVLLTLQQQYTTRFTLCHCIDNCRVYFRHSTQSPRHNKISAESIEYTLKSFC